jgi:hypothetical protein
MFKNSAKKVFAAYIQYVFLHIANQAQQVAFGAELRDESDWQVGGDASNQRDNMRVPAQTLQWAA